MLKSLTLEGFTVFPSAHFDFSLGINAFVGENATGKTHLLKIAYCLDRAWADLSNKSLPLSNKRTDVYFEERLLRLFQSANFSDLVRRGQGGCNLGGEVYLEALSDDLLAEGNDNERHSLKTNEAKHSVIWKVAITQQVLNFGYPEWSLIAALDEDSLSNLNKKTCLSKSVFFPSKEVVSLYEGLLGLLERYDIKLDATYRDLLLAINSPEINRLPNWFYEVFGDLEHDLGGKLTLDKTRLVFQDASEFKTEASMMAEGYRKLSLLMYLVRHDAIQEQGGTLFWDEPEANLNPRLMVKLAKILVALAGHGIQVNFATHSLFFLKEIDLQLKLAAELRPVPARFFALSDDGNGVKVSAGNSLEEVDTIVALDMEIEQAERFEEWYYRKTDKAA